MALVSTSSFPREELARHVSATSISSSSDRTYHTSPSGKSDSLDTFKTSATPDPSPRLTAPTSKKRALGAAVDCLRNMRHVFTKTPQEFERAELRRAKFDVDGLQVTSSWGDYQARTRFDPPDLDYIRVRLYLLIGNKIKPTYLFDDIPVCHNGKANFKLTKDRWRLQNITVVDADWAQFVELKSPYTLSSETLASLTNEYHRLYILEQPSPGRVAARRCRSLFLGNRG